MNKTLVTVLGLALVAPAHATDNAGATAASPQDTAAIPDSAAAPAAVRSSGTLARAALTTAVIDREPADNITQLAADKEKIYYFTEVKNMAGQTVTHRWEHNGKIVSEVKLDIGGPRWRVYSSKTLNPGLTGDWKVSVVDANGATVGANTFAYTAAAATATPAANTATNSGAQPTPAVLNGGGAPSTTAAPTR